MNDSEKYVLSRDKFDSRLTALSKRVEFSETDFVFFKNYVLENKYKIRTLVSKNPMERQFEVADDLLKDLSISSQLNKVSREERELIIRKILKVDTLMSFSVKVFIIVYILDIIIASTYINHDIVGIGHYLLLALFLVIVSLVPTFFIMMFISLLDARVRFYKTKKWFK